MQNKYQIENGIFSFLLLPPFQKKVGTLDWTPPFPADASSTSAGNSPVTESPYIVVKRSYFSETEEV